MSVARDRVPKRRSFVWTTVSERAEARTPVPWPSGEGGGEGGGCGVATLTVADASGPVTPAFPCHPRDSVTLHGTGDAARVIKVPKY